ncbi:MAG: hypothetical protein CVT79_10470 [Alphaproteobacteria bacterium HGW-Alphaproteobacteria-18]|nr:MAG: hypothetical protein CVT79_10470 [Alphaproteobacteria bacterium HGW-Alphaproteobacteria-18]
MNRSLVFYGHHKCGSRYFRTYLLKEIAKIGGAEFHQYSISDPVFEFEHPDDLDFYNVDFQKLTERACVMGLTNASRKVVDKIEAADPEHVGIHVIRDPRQFLVSCYFHHLDGHPVETPLWRWPKLGEDRLKLQTLSQEDGLIYEMDNIAGSIIERQIRPWEEKSNIIEVKLEDLDVDLAGFMSDIGKRLGLNLDVITPRQEMRFENPNSVQWREVFTPPVADAFRQRFNDILLRYGYETNPNWDL